MRRKQNKLVALAAVILAVSLIPAQTASAYDIYRHTDFQDNSWASDNKAQSIERYKLYDELVKFSNQRVNKNVLTSGDTVRFYVDVDDSVLKSKKCSELEDQYWKYFDAQHYFDGDGVRNIALVLVPEKADKSEIVVLNKSRDNADGTSRFTGKLKIGAYMTSGKWKIKDLYVNYDDSPEEYGMAMLYGNRAVYANSAMPDLSWGDFKVTGTKKDSSAPKVYDIKVERLDNGKKQISWKIKDKNLKKCYAEYYGGSHLLKTKKVKGKNNTYTYVLSKTYDEENEQINIYAVDQAGNQSAFAYSNGEITKGSNQKYASVKPKASDLKVSQKKVDKGQDVKISVKLKVQNNYKMKNIEAYYESPYGGYTRCVRLKRGKGSVWEGTFHTVESMPSGKWTLAAIGFDDGKSGCFSIENTKYCKSITDPYSLLRFRQDLSAGSITVK